VLNWTDFPNLAVSALLAWAFASVVRQRHGRDSGLWLIAWLMIVAHFAAILFQQSPGNWGTLAKIVSTAELAWAGILFTWATIPYREEISSRWLVALLLAGNTLYIAVLLAGPAWALIPAAVFIGTAPLTLVLLYLPKFNHPIRWITTAPYCVLSAFLLLFQYRPGNGSDLAINAVLFNIYLGCSIRFINRYRRATAGTFITITGFVAWASLFLISPLTVGHLGLVHSKNDIWNLPKYLVAVGMMLLLLEEQIEHNKHLALHDDLTGLPNRRLFQDRLARAIERARRAKTQAALLVLDLDAFKRVNDTMGHHVGDLLLQEVGSILSGRVRRSDTAARTGGDEFSVILEGPANREDALFVGSSLKKLISRPMQLGEHVVQTSASIGIAVFPEDAADMEALCIAADLRMYKAKHDSAAKQHAQTAFSNPVSFPELQKEKHPVSPAEQ
jgi:diguanylate cyclase (GGDEF)-like protein